ncbi:MAG: ATP synthase F1 subunit delta [Dehalococcoidales bacterium]|nr:ATP synthase F1 subunit delta [Dehalococcoidales bacterium]
MINRLSPKRYAQAVFQIAVESDSLDEWQADFQAINEIACRPNFVEILGNPKFRYEQKANFFREALKNISPMALNLVLLLIAKNKFRIACEIAFEYNKLLDQHRGIIHGEIIAAIPIRDEERLVIANRFGAKFGKKLYLTAKIDPSIIGGIILRVDGKIIDGSITTRLAGLKEQLTSGP